MSEKIKVPRDPNQLSKFIVVMTAKDKELSAKKPSKKNPYTLEMGKLGNLKSGKALTVRLASLQHSEITEKAAKKC